MIQNFQGSQAARHKAVRNSNKQTIKSIQKITGSKGVPYTDGNDNTWTIFEIPEKFFGDDVEIIEYKKGGRVVKLQDAFDQRQEAKFYPLLDNRKGVMQNPGGTVSTHRLSHEYIPELGGWVVFPTLFQKSSGEYYKSDDPIREAINRKELYRFGDDWKSATRLALGSFKPFVNRNR